MELIREVFRLKWLEKKSNRVVGQILKISKSTVATYLTRASLGKITGLEQLDSLNDERLRRIIFPDKFVKQEESSVDFAKVHQELKRKNMTLMLLWEEEAEKNPTLYCYNQFCFHYRKWKKLKKISMRQVHKAGGERIYRLCRNNGSGHRWQNGRGQGSANISYLFGSESLHLYRSDLDTREQGFFKKSCQRFRIFWWSTGDTGSG